MTQKTNVSVFDVIESAHSFRKVRGSVENTQYDSGYVAVATNDNKVRVTRAFSEVEEPVRVNVIGIGYGVIRQVRFDSDNRAIYDILLDDPIVTAIDQSRDCVARREELEEVSA